MLGKFFSIMCLISVFFAVFSGNTENIGTAVMDGAERAITLSISLCGMMCLWSGIMNVLEKANITQKLSRIFHPFIRFAFPDVAKTSVGEKEICSSICANMLGIGNAATPLGIKAMQKMQKIYPDKAGNDMITFAVMNTAPLSLIPQTLITLRNAAGSQNPFLIIVPVWICSFASFMFSVFISRALALFSNRRGL